MKPLGSTYQGKGETMRGTAATHAGKYARINGILELTELTERPVWSS
jgi:hypothetical protein